MGVSPTDVKMAVVAITRDIGCTLQQFKEGDVVPGLDADKGIATKQPRPLLVREHSSTRVSLGTRSPQRGQPTIQLRPIQVAPLVLSNVLGPSGAVDAGDPTVQLVLSHIVPALTHEGVSDAEVQELFGTVAAASAAIAQLFEGLVNELRTYVSEATSAREFPLETEHYAGDSSSVILMLSCVERLVMCDNSTAIVAARWPSLLLSFFETLSYIKLPDECSETTQATFELLWARAKQLLVLICQWRAALEDIEEQGGYSTLLMMLLRCTSHALYGDIGSICHCVLDNVSQEKITLLQQSSIVSKMFGSLRYSQRANTEQLRTFLSVLTHLFTASLSCMNNFVDELVRMESVPVLLEWASLTLRMSSSICPEDGSLSDRSAHQQEQVLRSVGQSVLSFLQEITSSTDLTSEVVTNARRAVLLHLPVLFCAALDIPKLQEDVLGTLTSVIMCDQASATEVVETNSNRYVCMVDDYSRCSDGVQSALLAHLEVLAIDLGVFPEAEYGMLVEYLEEARALTPSTCRIVESLRRLMENGYVMEAYIHSLGATGAVLSVLKHSAHFPTLTMMRRSLRRGSDGGSALLEPVFNLASGLLRRDDELVKVLNELRNCSSVQHKYRCCLLECIRRYLEKHRGSGAAEQFRCNEGFEVLLDVCANIEVSVEGVGKLDADMSQASRMTLESCASKASDDMDIIGRSLSRLSTSRPSSERSLQGRAPLGSLRRAGGDASGRLGFPLQRSSTGLKQNTIQNSRGPQVDPACKSSIELLLRTFHSSIITSPRNEMYAKSGRVYKLLANAIRETFFTESLSEVMDSLLPFMFQVLFDVTLDRMPDSEGPTQLVGERFTLPQHAIVRHPGIIRVILRLLEDRSGDLEKNIYDVLILLAGFDPQNREAMTDFDVLALFIRYQEKVLTDENHFLHPRALRFVEMLGSHRFTTRALRRFLDLLKPPEKPISLLKALNRVAFNSVTSPFVEFDIKQETKSAHVRVHDLNPAKNWPPQKGYSFSCWIRFDADPEKKTNAGPVRLQRRTASVLNEGSLSAVKQTLAQEKSVGKKRQPFLVLQLSRSAETKLTRVSKDRTEAKRKPLMLSDMMDDDSLASSDTEDLDWHESGCGENDVLKVVVGPDGYLELHSLSNGRNATTVMTNFQFSPCKWYHVVILHQSFSNSSSKASLYVDGMLCDNRTLAYPDFPSQPLTMQMGAAQTKNFYHPAIWTMGTFFFMLQPLTPEEITSIFVSGQDFYGFFSSAMLSQTPADAPVLPPTTATYINRTPLEALGVRHVGDDAMLSDVMCIKPVNIDTRYVWFAYSAGNTTAEVDIDPMDTVEREEHIAWYGLHYMRNLVHSEGQPFAQFFGGAYPCNPGSVCDDFRKVDGLRIAISLIERADTIAFLEESVRFLSQLLRKSEFHLDEMKRIHGYDCVALLLRRRGYLMSSRTLDYIFSIIHGVPYEDSPLMRKRHLVANTMALQYFVLDFGVWKLSTEHIHHNLFTRLSYFLTDSVFWQWNLMRFEAANVYSLILKILYDEAPPLNMVTTLLKVIRAFLQRGQNPEHYRSLYSFLLTTVPQIPSEEETLHRRRVRKRRVEAPKVVGFYKDVPIRNAVLGMLTEMLEDNNEGTTRLIASTFDMAFFTIFMSIDLDESTVLAALRMLVVMIQRSREFMVQFFNHGGFPCFEDEILRLCRCADAYVILLGLVLGRVDMGVFEGGKFTADSLVSLLHTDESDDSDDGSSGAVTPGSGGPLMPKGPSVVPGRRMKDISPVMDLLYQMIRESANEISFNRRRLERRTSSLSPLSAMVPTTPPEGGSSRTPRHMLVTPLGDHDADVDATSPVDGGHEGKKHWNLVRSVFKLAGLKAEKKPESVTALTSRTDSADSTDSANRPPSPAYGEFMEKYGLVEGSPTLSPRSPETGKPRLLNPDESDVKALEACENRSKWAKGKNRPSTMSKLPSLTDGQAFRSVSSIGPLLRPNSLLRAMDLPSSLPIPMPMPSASAVSNIVANRSGSKPSALRKTLTMQSTVMPPRTSTMNAIALHNTPDGVIRTDASHTDIVNAVLKFMNKLVGSDPEFRCAMGSVQTLEMTAETMMYCSDDGSLLSSGAGADSGISSHGRTWTPLELRAAANRNSIQFPLRTTPSGDSPRGFSAAGGSNSGSRFPMPPEHSPYTMFWSAAGLNDDEDDEDDNLMDPFSPKPAGLSRRAMFSGVSGVVGATRGGENAKSSTLCFPPCVLSGHENNFLDVLSITVDAFRQRFSNPFTSPGEAELENVFEGGIDSDLHMQFSNGMYYLNDFFRSGNASCQPFVEMLASMIQEELLSREDTEVLDRVLNVWIRSGSLGRKILFKSKVLVSLIRYYDEWEQLAEELQTNAVFRGNFANFMTMMAELRYHGWFPVADSIVVSFCTKLAGILEKMTVEDITDEFVEKMTQLYSALCRVLLYELTCPLDESIAIAALEACMDLVRKMTASPFVHRKLICCIAYVLMRFLESPNSFVRDAASRCWHLFLNADRGYKVIVSAIRSVGDQREIDEWFACVRPTATDANSSSPLSPETPAYTGDFLARYRSKAETYKRIFHTYIGKFWTEYAQFERERRLKAYEASMSDEAKERKARNRRERIKTRSVSMVRAESMISTRKEQKTAKFVFKKLASILNDRYGYGAEEWMRIREVLFRERGVWGSDGTAPDFWQLDLTECSHGLYGYYRLRVRLIANPGFVSFYRFSGRESIQSTVTTESMESTDSKLIPRTREERKRSLFRNMSRRRNQITRTMSTALQSIMVTNEAPRSPSAAALLRRASSNLNSIFSVDSPLSPHRKKHTVATHSPKVVQSVASDSVELDHFFKEYQSMRHMLDVDDKVRFFYNCYLVKGLDPCHCILLLCDKYIYVIENYGVNEDKEVLEIVKERGKNEVTLRRPSKDHQFQSYANVLNAADATPDWKTQLSQDFSLNKGRAHAFHKWAVTDVWTIHRRTYSLRPVGIEVFCRNGSNYLLVFDPNQREEAFDRIEALTGLSSRDDKRAIPSLNPISPESLSVAVSDQRSSLASFNFFRQRLGGGGQSGMQKKEAMALSQMTRLWANGLCSNFEYLMFLNTLAGRSFNDLTQYPVVPWVLADYKSNVLDLEDPAVYRDLGKPMGMLNPNRAELFMDRYREMESSQQMSSDMEPPFHYGTHYSSASAVLYFLVRLEPFSQQAVTLHDGGFDLTDRLFNSIEEAWQFASGQGDGLENTLSDVKELIPEFYYLPDFLSNPNRFDFGVTLSGEEVSSVKLPPWASDPKDFIMKHRAALESDYVSEHLNEWIDLIFGFKQTGENAVKANNVFHYLTYEGAVDIDAIEDPVIRSSIQNQINSFGQTPHQLFTKPHPKRKVQPKVKVSHADIGLLPFPEYLSAMPIVKRHSNPSTSTALTPAAVPPAAQYLPSSPQLLAMTEKASAIPKMKLRAAEAPLERTARAAATASLDAGAVKSLQQRMRGKSALTQSMHLNSAGPRSSMAAEDISGRTPMLSRHYSFMRSLENHPRSRGTGTSALRNSVETSLLGRKGTLQQSRASTAATEAAATAVEELSHHASGIGDVRVAAGGRAVLSYADEILIPPLYTHVMSWHHPDSALRIYRAHRAQESSGSRDYNEQPMRVFKSPHISTVTCAAMTSDGRNLVVGGTDTLISVWSVVFPDTADFPTPSATAPLDEMDSYMSSMTLDLVSDLCAHDDVITSLAVSSLWHVIVSGGRDRRVIVWDLNKLKFIRQLPRHEVGITSLWINERSGEIVTCAGTVFRVFSINGDLLYIKNTATAGSGKITACTTTCGPEWLDNGLYITGHENGSINFWGIQYRENSVFGSRSDFASMSSVVVPSRSSLIADDLEQLRSSNAVSNSRRKERRESFSVAGRYANLPSELDNSDDSDDGNDDESDSNEYRCMAEAGTAALGEGSSDIFAHQFELDRVATADTLTLPSAAASRGALRALDDSDEVVTGFNDASFDDSDDSDSQVPTTGKLRGPMSSDGSVMIMGHRRQKTLVQEKHRSGLKNFYLSKVERASFQTVSRDLLTTDRSYDPNKSIIHCAKKDQHGSAAITCLMLHALSDRTILYSADDGGHVNMWNASLSQLQQHHHTHAHAASATTTAAAGTPNTAGSVTTAPASSTRSLRASFMRSSGENQLRLGDA